MKLKIVNTVLIMVAVVILFIPLIAVEKEINVVTTENVQDDEIPLQEAVGEENKEEQKEETTTKTTKSKVTTKKKITKKATKKVVNKTTTKKTTPRVVSWSKSEYQAYAKNLVINTYGWTEYDFQCLVKLWNRESGWNPNAHNKSSGAHGIPQSLPASKMKSEGSDYYTNGYTQIRWGLKYIKSRYGSPSKAWAHSQRKGWY